MIRFEKYHGTGNDFIIIDGLLKEYANLPLLAKAMCDRHKGIGADGLIVVTKPNDTFFMTFYNADGTIAPMCGNGIRCYAKYLYEHHYVWEPLFPIDTLAGRMQVELTIQHSLVDSVKVNMGQPIFELSPKDVQTQQSTWINQELNGFQATILTMGTLHCVIFVDQLTTVPISVWGHQIESLEIFPQKINVNFCEIIDQDHIKVMTYERGVGPTLSCGTGSSATAIVSQLLHNTHDVVFVDVPGGTLEIEQKASQVYLKGPAAFICSGLYNEVKV